MNPDIESAVSKVKKFHKLDKIGCGILTTLLTAILFVDVTPIIALCKYMILTTLIINLLTQWYTRHTLRKVEILDKEGKL